MTPEILETDRGAAMMPVIEGIVEGAEGLIRDWQLLPNAQRALRDGGADILPVADPVKMWDGFGTAKATIKVRRSVIRLLGPPAPVETAGSSDPGLSRF